jgi:hypothetical protein
MAGIGRNRQVLQVPPAAVVPAKHCANQPATFTRRKTHPRVMFQVTSDCFGRISTAEANARHSEPQSVNLGVVCHTHHSKHDFLVFHRNLD